MERILIRFRKLDAEIIHFLKPRALSMLRISIGLIYVLFGVLKFFPQYSPAEQLASDTIRMMTFGKIDGTLSMYLLAFIEVGIGVGLIIGKKLKLFIRITLWHMLCTFFPMLFMPNATYSTSPTSLSLVGQYILKNIIIISALLTIYTADQSKNKRPNK